MVVTTASPVREHDLPHYLQPPYPTVFTLEITQRCHHKCRGCGNVFLHTGREMDCASWEKIIARLRPYAQALRITGGEPTLHKQFAQIMETVEAEGLPFVLFTNGNWVEPQFVIDILQRCSHLRGILVSLHGIDARSYFRFTGVDAFDKVTNNIQLAVDAGLRVATNTLLLTTTYRQIAAIAGLALSMGVSTVSFGRYYGPPLPGLSLTTTQLRRALAEIAALRRHNNRITLSNCVPACFLPDEDFGGRGCTSGFTHCTVGPGGGVRPCTHTPLKLGYIQEEEIEALWQSPCLHEWRLAVPAPCRTCAALNRCRGGCRATAQQLKLSADPLMRNPLSEEFIRPVLNLASQARTQLACSIQPTSYGYALTGQGHFVTLSHLSDPILKAIEEHSTIGQICAQFGDAGLQLVGGLVQRRLIELE